jgi:hypothetical protein
VTKVLIQYLGNVSLFLVCRTAEERESVEFAILLRHRGEHLQRLLVSIQVKAGEQGGAVHQQSPVLHGYCQSFLHYYLERICFKCLFCIDMFLGIELTLVVPENNTSETVLWIPKSVVRIRIRTIDLRIRTGCCSFRRWLSECQQK